MDSTGGAIRWVGWWICWILSLVMAGLPVAAVPQESSGTPDSPETDGQISLAEALELTVGLDPQTRIAWHKTFVQRGLADQAKGLFDSSLSIFTGYEHSEGELLASQIKAEIDRRNLHRDLINDFTRIADDLERQIEEGKSGSPDCGTIIVINGINICSTEVDRLGNDAFKRLLDQLVESENDPILRDVLTDLQEHLSTESQRLTQIIIDVLRSVVPGQEISLAKLGEIPEFEERSFFQLDLRLLKSFRNGVLLTGGLVLEGEEDNFDSKVLLSDFGGKGIPNTYTSLVGLGIEIPLGKGWGEVSTGAPERAAELGYEASVLDSAHTASESLLRTQLAYWNLVAAQERLRLLEETLEIQGELYETVSALIEADEIPRAELARVRARVSSAERQASSAQQDVLSARILLAEAIGLDIGSQRDTFKAADGFPTVPEVDELDSRLSDLTIPEALSRRNDLRAAVKREEAADVLQQAAQRDLRRRFDLALSAGYGGLYESFEDDVWDPGAFGETLTEDWAGPSVSFSLKVDASFANRVARGELEQTLALSRQSQIRARDIERRIGLRVEELTGSLEKAADEVRRRSGAVSLRARTLRDTVARFQAGEASVINTVLTEEQLTAARLLENAARQSFAALSSELQFEMGYLATYRDEDGRIRLEIDPAL